jgi:hypothetical protein
MSIENISISIDPSPLRTFIKSLLKEEATPTLYGNDRILDIVKDHTQSREFEGVVSDIVRGDIADLVRDNISYSDLAEEIDVSDVASYIRMSRLAAEISTSDIANEISLHDIASEISTADIASEIDIEDLADTIVQQHIDLESVADKIDYKKLAAALLDVIAERSKSAPIL